MLFFARRWLWVVLFLPPLAGCGDGRSAANVSGKITVKGQPLADIGVTFQPVGEGIGSTGQTDAEGRYALQFVDNQQTGAAVGKHQVTFHDLLDQPAESPDAGPLPPSKSRLSAAARSTVHEFEVPAGGTASADFDLK
jgi:hypothetical protein